MIGHYVLNNMETLLQNSITIFDINPLPMLLVKQNGNIIRVNKQFCTLIKKEEAELDDAVFYDLFLTSSEEDLWWFDYFWEDGEFNNIESYIMDSDQKTLDILVSGIMLYPHSEEACFLLTIQDIGQLRRNQQALYQARLDAEQANKGKSQFLSHVTHELKTPLNVIMGYAQLITYKEGLDPKKCYEHAKQIYSSGLHLLGLINNLLDLSQIEAGGFDVSMNIVNIQDILTNVMDTIKPLLLEKNLTCHSQINEQAILVFADRLRLKQVMLNLLSNAIKYTPEGGQIKCVLEVLNTQYLRLSVIDTGEGIAPDKLDQLFLPFERLTSNASKIEGTGIGLTISKMLIEKMGGSIGVTTKIEEGSTFYIDIQQANYEN